jgi:hypothetical protein
LGFGDTGGGDYNLRRSKARAVAKFAKIELICISCGSTKNLVVHHIDLDYTNNNPSNLQHMCNVCHGEFHNPKKEEKLL